ncbi:rab-GTPase-TBC domain-containing protein [Chytridium lagenaria]|nr:rab-GTPase-TBC domain-containing protein [Chytridium lagenaria]
MADLTTLQTLTQYHTTSALDAEETAFWNSIIEEANESKDSSSCISKISSLLTAKIRRGIPPHLRSQIWQIMVGAQPRALEDIYKNLLTEDSPSERIIKRDIPRTFPKLEMFKEEDGQGQKSLFNLLKAYSVFDQECGYCQGLSFVVAPLLLQNMSELEAFALFVRLMEESPSKGPQKYGLRTLFMPQMPGLHLLLYEHSELVRLYLPRLFGHLFKMGLWLIHMHRPGS